MQGVVSLIKSNAFFPIWIVSFTSYSFSRRACSSLRRAFSCRLGSRASRLTSFITSFYLRASLSFTTLSKLCCIFLTAGSYATRSSFLFLYPTNTFLMYYFGVWVKSTIIGAPEDSESSSGFYSYSTRGYGFSLHRDWCLRRASVVLCPRPQY